MNVDDPCNGCVRSHNSKIKSTSIFYQLWKQASIASHYGQMAKFKNIPPLYCVYLLYFIVIVLPYLCIFISDMQMTNWVKWLMLHFNACSNMHQVNNINNSIDFYIKPKSNFRTFMNVSETTVWEQTWGFVVSHLWLLNKGLHHSSICAFRSFSPQWRMKPERAVQDLWHDSHVSMESNWNFVVDLTFTLKLFPATVRKRVWEWHTKVHSLHWSNTLICNHNNSERC